MNALMRRRGMMQSKKQESWGIDWDYTMGAPSKYGLRTRLVGNGTASFVADKGAYLRPNNYWYMYAYFEPNPALADTDKCVIEATLDLVAKGTYGLRATVKTNDGVFQYTLTQTGTHTLRIERFRESNKVYLDGVLVFSGDRTDATGNYVVGHTCLWMQSGGETYVKSYRISVN